MEAVIASKPAPTEDRINTENPVGAGLLAMSAKRSKNMSVNRD
ncbi:hypothetical protein EMIT0P44_20176 [Pseudomonas sp. IT-P44]